MSKTIWCLTVTQQKVTYQQGMALLRYYSIRGCCERPAYITENRAVLLIPLLERAKLGSYPVRFIFGTNVHALYNAAHEAPTGAWGPLVQQCQSWFQLLLSCSFPAHSFQQATHQQHSISSFRGAASQQRRGSLAADSS